VAITAASAVALARLRTAGGPVALHSHYPSGVNLDVGGILVYAGPGAAGGACSLEVTTADVAVLAGSPAWLWHRGGLICADGSVSVAMAEAARVYVPPTPRLAALDPAAGRRLRLARTATGSPSWFSEGVGRDVALPRLRTAVACLVTPAPHDAGALVRGVVGLGGGLTPACDDALVAALCLLHACGHRPAVTAADLLGGAPATTDVSASALRLALAGAFSSRLARVVNLLGPSEADDSRLRLAVRDLASIGATSGADSLMGLELACDALAVRDRLRPSIPSGLLGAGQPSARSMMSIGS